MTIALGLIAHDGVVIAADRQETEGDFKKDQRKIESLYSSSIGGLLVAGAGNGPYIDAVTTKLQFCWGQKAWDWDETSEMTEKFREVHSKFYSEAVLPFASYPWNERPDYEVLFGCTVKKHNCLWYSHKLTLNEAQGYRAVGVGASTAESLLKKFYVSRLPLPVAISLAAYVIYQVKNSIDQCGFETDVMFTEDQQPPSFVGAPLMQEMEDAFAKFRLLERDDLYKCIGGDMVPPNRDAKGWNKLRRDLAKTFDGFYDAFKKRPAFKDSMQSALEKLEPEP